MAREARSAPSLVAAFSRCLRRRARADRLGVRRRLHHLPTIENFLNGDGIRYNPAERVQSYTHPLWLFLLIPFRLVTGDVYFASLALSFACTLLAIVTGLLARGPERVASHPWAIQGTEARDGGEAVVIRDTVGLFGYFAGAGVHVVDFYALTDPLLAKLPARADPSFRPGHFTRGVPTGYYETLGGRANALEDPSLSRYYARIAWVTRGDLFSFERLRAIISLNLRTRSAEIDVDRYRYFGRERLALEAFGPSARIRRMTGSGLRVELLRPLHDALVEVGLDCDDDYRVLFYLGEAHVGTTDLPPLCPDRNGEIERRTVTAPPRAREEGYDALWILPTGGARPFRIAHVTLVR